MSQPRRPSAKEIATELVWAPITLLTLGALVLVILPLVRVALFVPLACLGQWPPERKR